MIRVILTHNSIFRVVGDMESGFGVMRTNSKVGANVGAGTTRVGDSIEFAKGKPLVLRRRGKVILTTSVVENIFNEKGKEVR